MVTINERNLNLKIHDIDQLLASADDVNMIGDNINTLERNAKVVLKACKDTVLDVNTEKLSRPTLNAPSFKCSR